MSAQQWRASSVRPRVNCLQRLPVREPRQYPRRQPRSRARTTRANESPRRWDSTQTWQRRSPRSRLPRNSVRPRSRARSHRFKQQEELPRAPNPPPRSNHRGRSAPAQRTRLSSPSRPLASRGRLIGLSNSPLGKKAIILWCLKSSTTWKKSPRRTSEWLRTRTRASSTTSWSNLVRRRRSRRSSRR